MSVVNKNPVHVCDFCGKDQNEVDRIIASQNGIDICDECVVLCVEVLLGDKEKEMFNVGDVFEFEDYNEHTPYIGIVTSNKKVYVLWDTDYTTKASWIDYEYGECVKNINDGVWILKKETE